MSVTKPSEDILAIRLDRLEEDCAGSPRMRYVWGVEHARIRRDVRDLKKALKLKAAEIGSAVRSTPKGYGLDRATDKAVEEITLLDLDYQNLQDQLSQAEYEEDVLHAFIQGVEDRKEQLGNEVKLHGQMYWSKPDTNAADATPQKRVADAQAAKVNSRPKKKKVGEVDYFPD